MTTPQPGPTPVPRPRYTWRAKVTSLLFAIFCFELGAFLLVFPWTEFWEQNYFAWVAPDSPERLPLAQWWHELWLSPGFRGAISGIGLLNLGVALSSVFRLRRYAPPPESVDDQDVPIE